ncbi:unnamed protein product [Camellia sinensis]
MSSHTHSAPYYYTMATALSRFSLFVTLLLLFLLVASLFEPTHGGIVGDGASIRSLRSNQRNNRIVDCSEVASKSHCSQYSNKCRWCRSEALDDMCFSKSEAWRLPSQQFKEIDDSLNIQEQLMQGKKYKKLDSDGSNGADL